MFRKRRLYNQRSEGEISPQQDGGTTPAAHRQHGGVQHELSDHQTLRRVPIFHQRNPVRVGGNS